MLVQARQFRKRAMALLLALALSLMMVPAMAVNAYADPVGTAEVSVGAPSGAPAGGYQPGDILTVPVNIADNPGIAAVSLTVQFDTDVFEYVASSLSSAAPAVFGSGNWIIVPVDSNAANGRVAVSALYSPGVAKTSNCTDNGTLFTLQLKVKDGALAGSSAITVQRSGGDLANNFTDMGSADNNWVPQPVPVHLSPYNAVIKTSGPAPTATVTVADAPNTVAPGDSFTLPVTISGNPGFAGAAFTLGYDANAFELTSLDAVGGLFANGLLSDLASATAGYASLNMISADGVIFNAAFKVKDTAAAGDYAISVGLKDGNALNFVDNLANPVDVAFSAGTVTVASTAVPPTGTTIVVGSVGSVASGQTITLPVSIVNNPGFLSANLHVSFDSSVLELQDIVQSDALPANTFFIANVPAGNVIFFNTASINSNIGLFNLVFKVKDGVLPTVSPVSVGPVQDQPKNFADASGPLPVDFMAGSVSITKAPAPTITWPTAGTIRQGQMLSDSPLSFDANQYGTFVWADPNHKPARPGGAFTLTFVPNDWAAANFEPITPASEDINVKVVLSGDIDDDGYLTSYDASMILQHASGFITLTGDALVAADVDGDATITTTDAVLAAQIAVGLIPQP